MNKTNLHFLFRATYLFVANFFFLTTAQKPSDAITLRFGVGGGSFLPSVRYEITSGRGLSVVTSRNNPTILSPAQALNLAPLNAYANANGWTFQPGSVLGGEFIIGNYYACGPSALATQSQQGQNPSCWVNSNNRSPKQTVDSSVGAYFTLAYQPGPQDPNNFPKLRWIQIVEYSNSANISTSFVDNKNNINLNPYYPNFGTLNNTLFTFEDAPTRGDIYLSSQKWKASLFLVQETATKTVTIHSGISWGWSSIASSLPQNSPPPSPPRIPHQQASNPNGVCPPGMPTGSCIAFGYLDNSSINALVDSSLLSFDEPSAPTVTSTNSQPDTNNTATVPEPSSMLGVLAVGAWAGISWRKRRNQQSESELVAASST